MASVPATVPVSGLVSGLLASGVIAATTFGSGPLALEFDAGVDDWQVVVDGVMGGRSSGRVSQLSSGLLRFTGRLSLENNGGFSQIRRAVEPGALDGAAGIELRVRGDGRTYQFDLRASNARVMAGSYQVTFDTTGDWQTMRLPFDAFVLHDFGRRVSNAPDLDPAIVESIGITLADKNPGAFELTVDRVAAYGETASSAPTATGTTASPRGVLAVLERAIDQGVPLFNDGSPEACAAVYDVAVTAILELAPGTLDGETRTDLARARSAARADRDPRAAAWTLRRAMDRAYVSLDADGRVAAR